MFDCRFYYNIANKKNQKALQFNSNQQYAKLRPTFNKVYHNCAQQIWIMKQTQIQNVYRIAHADTTLVLQKMIQGPLQLHHEKDKKNQFFYIMVCNTEKHEFWISQYMNPQRYLLNDEEKIICQQGSKENLSAIWTIERVTKTQVIERSCIISCEYSGFVLQIGDKSDQLGKPLFQSSWQSFLNQKWIIKKQKQFYTISNLKSGLFISFHTKTLKQNTPLVQLPQSSTFQHQLWSLQERGHRLYSIRSAYSQSLFIGTKNHELKEKAEIVLVKDEFKNLWKIIGPFLT